MKTEKMISKPLQTMPESKMTMYFNLGDDVLSLGLGEPGFPTPMSAAQGGINAIKEGRTFYPPSSGYADLRKATSKYLKERFGLKYSSKEVLITMGASIGLDAIFRAYINPGDEVIITSPAYGYYAMLAGFSGAKIIYAKTYERDGWILKANVLKSLITDKTKFVVLNYPNNPTGATMTKAQFEAVAKVLRGTDILVVTDEIYAEYVYNGKQHSILECEGMRERTFYLSGYSKSLAMTGWRLGYIAAPLKLIKPVETVNAAMTLCASGPAQEAALAGLKNSRNDIEYMRGEYIKRRDYILSRLDEFGWTYVKPNGGFYIWANIARTGLDSTELSTRLIKEAKVAVIMGEVYGNEHTDYVRITLTGDMERLKEAFDRIRIFLIDNKMM